MMPREAPRELVREVLGNLLDEVGNRKGAIDAHAYLIGVQRLERRQLRRKQVRREEVLARLHTLEQDSLRQVQVHEEGAVTCRATQDVAV